MTTGAPAAKALWNGTMPACSSRVHGWVVAGATSVLPEAWPSPGKCLTTGITPPASSPCMKAMPSVAATPGLRPNDRVPSGSRLFGPTPLSRSSTGARSMVIPAARIRWATPVTSWRIWAGDIDAAICLAEGSDPTRFAIRWTTPPSSSVITNGAMPPGADAERLCRLVARSAGADDPKRITPPAPAATSAVTAATSRLARPVPQGSAPRDG